jgi:hypothetical protein
LQRVYFAVQGFAAAVWLRTPQGNLQLQTQINVREVGLDLIQRDRTFRAVLPLFGAAPEQGIPIQPGDRIAQAGCLDVGRGLGGELREELAERADEPVEARPGVGVGGAPGPEATFAVV